MKRAYPAIQIVHPMGEFFLTAIPARILLKVTFSDVYTCLDNSYVGHQRKLDPRRVAGIRRYVESSEAVFPGTIILAANTKPWGGSLGLADSRCWYIEPNSRTDNVVKLVIPTEERVSAIVDGQHRLAGFENSPDDISDILLPCAVFIGMPTTQQANVFATINYNQRSVSKSMTYELFGYGLDDDDIMRWPPERLAVFLSRRLNADKDSPFFNHVKLAAVDGRLAPKGRDLEKSVWVVSTATVVEGILSLISSNPRADHDEIFKRTWFGGKRDRTALSLRDRDKVLLPLRARYLNGEEDRFIYDVLVCYFSVVRDLFWTDESCWILHKASGIQALFKVLKRVYYRVSQTVNVLDRKTWMDLFEKVRGIDFSNEFFTESSGSGSGRIRNAILYMMFRDSLKEGHEVARGLENGSLMRNVYA